MRRLLVASLLVVLAWPASAVGLTDDTKDDFTVAYRAAKGRCGEKPGPHLRKVPGEPSSARYHAWTKKLHGMCLPPPPQPQTRSKSSAAPLGSTAEAPTAVTPPASTGRSSGGFCGAYQFNDQTWQSVGGSGSACGASPAEQDRRAQMLLDQRGTQPWPNCGSTDLAAIRQCENGGRY